MRIPNADDISRDIPRSERGVTPTPQITTRFTPVLNRVVDQGAGDIGKAIFNAGLDLEAIDERRRARQDQIAVAKAKSGFLQDQIRLSSSLTDEDYGTYTKRFQEGMNKSRDKWLGTIKNPEARELLGAELQLTQTRGASAVYEKQLAREKDYEVAGLESDMGVMLEDVYRAENIDDIAEIRKTLEFRLDGHRQADHITARQRDAYLKAFDQTWALTRLERMSDAEQLSVLRAAEEDPNHWASIVPAAKRVPLLKRAMAATEEDNTRAQAQHAFDRVLTEFPELGDDAYKAVRKRYSGKVEDSLISRMDAQRARDSALSNESKRALVDQGYETIQDGGSLDDIPSRTKVEMMAQGVWDDVVRLKDQMDNPGRYDPIEALRAWDDFTADANRMDPDDFVTKWNRAALEARMAPEKMQAATAIIREAEGLKQKAQLADVAAREKRLAAEAAEQKQTIKDVAIGNGIKNDRDEAAFRLRVARGIELFKTREKREPTVSEVKDIAMEKARDHRLQSESSIKQILGMKDEVKRFEVETEGVPPEWRKYIIGMFGQMGQPLTEERLVREYLRLREEYVKPGDVAKPKATPPSAAAPGRGRRHTITSKPDEEELDITIRDDVGSLLEKGLLP